MVREYLLATHYVNYFDVLPFAVIQSTLNFDLSQRRQESLCGPMASVKQRPLKLPQTCVATIDAS